jgi:putative transposase
MARLARVVAPGLPHHVTQRGNGRSRVFFSEADYALYHDLLADACREAKVEVWAWVLMPNHVHLILKPAGADGLRRALASVHRRYAGAIQRRRKRTGHFWQGRFASAVMDEDYLAVALRYVSLNPVRARLTKRPQDWKWSSVRAHLGLTDDGLTEVRPALRRFPRFADLIGEPADAEAVEKLRQAESVGRPLGSPAFLARLEKRFGRPLAAQKRGPKPARERSDKTSRRRGKKRALSR